MRKPNGFSWYYIILCIRNNDWDDGVVKNAIFVKTKFY